METPHFPDNDVRIAAPTPESIVDILNIRNLCFVLRDRVQEVTPITPTMEEDLSLKSGKEHVEELGHIDTITKFHLHPVPSNQAEDPLNWPLSLKVC